MQFREVKRVKGGRAIEFVRWVYDPAKGRSVSEVLGRMSAYDSAVPAAVLAKLTTPEKADVDAWWASIVEGRRLAVLNRAAEAYHASGYVEHVVDALAAGVVTAEAAVAVWATIDTLTAALKKAGHKRPAKSAKPAVAAKPTPLEAAVNAAKGG